ncbi:MAG: YSC84-related protein [Halieaceae bacterium]|jgi:lipid-binding SYLF domain-containing protein|nr:YSC84-related protein [Halieaceae bacterium]
MIIKSRLLSHLLAPLLLCTLVASAATADDAGREALDAKIEAALVALREKSPESAELLDKAEAVLVFPDVVKVGFGIGGEYGEGALLTDGETATYYSISGASFGLQLGAQSKTQIILFMSSQALRKFRRSKGWEAGVDGRVALVQAGAGGGLDTTTTQAPIIGFVFTNAGLMYNLTLEGSKITPLD